MDLLSLLRTLGGLGTVLGILAGALWLVRRYDLRLPGRSVTTLDRRLELIETLPIDSRRMVALLRRDGREHLILVAPEGHVIIESGVVRDDVDLAAAAARSTARAEATRARAMQRHASRPTMTAESAGALVAGLCHRVAAAGPVLKSLVDRHALRRGTRDVPPALQKPPHAAGSFGALVDRAEPRTAPSWLVLKSVPDHLAVSPAPPAQRQAASSAKRVSVRKPRTVTKESKVA
jgi:flagellar biogenesis protein FliO